MPVAIEESIPPPTGVLYYVIMCPAADISGNHALYTLTIHSLEQQEIVAAAN